MKRTARPAVESAALACAAALVSDTDEDRKTRSSSYSRSDTSRRRRTRAERLKHNDEVRRSSAWRRWAIGQIQLRRGCMFCRQSVPSPCLDAHHVNPDTKDFNLSAKGTLSWPVICTELEKCVIVCSNCHRKIEAGLVSITGLEPIHLTNSERQESYWKGLYAADLAKRDQARQ